MPHDRNGTELKVGDKVNVLCEVKSVTPSEDFCNVTLETVHPPNPANMTRSTLTTNAATTEKVE